MDIVTRLANTLRGLAGAASTALAGWLVSRLAVAGIDVDQAVLEALLIAVSGALVLQVEKLLNRYVPRSRLLLTVLRFGASLPVYAHQEEELQAYVAKHAKAA